MRGRVSRRTQSALAPLKPQLGFRRTVLGTATVLARVVHQDPVISIGACINVITLLRCAARRDVPRSPLLMITQCTLTSVRVNVITKYLLYGPRFHLAPVPASLPPYTRSKSLAHAFPELSHHLLPQLGIAQLTLKVCRQPIRKLCNKTLPGSLPFTLQSFGFAHDCPT